jgi:hypothetical protein
MIKLRSMDSGDKQFMVGAIIGPILVWWFFTGRKRYGTKGMK